MSIYGMRRRVACYVTRRVDAGQELLVFDHRDDDGTSGTQVPAGTMMTFESLVDAALREVREETGLTELVFGAQVGAVELGLDDEGGPSLTNVVHLEAPAEGERSWDHTVTGEGEDAGMVFGCRWEPLPLSFELAGGQGEFLDQLAGLTDAAHGSAAENTSGSTQSP